MTTNENQPPLISIVVPVYNEEGNVQPLFDAVAAEMESQWCEFEVVYVDDGSSDRSVECIKEMAAADHRVKLVRLSRNFGHQTAITAGIEAAQGDAVIMMDADLQHPPSLLPTMIERWKEGYDVVYTTREETRGVGVIKRFTSAAFYKLINTMVDTKIVPNAADFRLMDRKVVNCLNGLRERNRFVRGLVSWIGFRQTALPYVAQERFSGTTKYSFRKMIAFALDGITSFSTFPLRLSMYCGFLAAVAGVPYAIWAIYVRLFTDEAVTGWASLIVAVLFLGGVQLICLGILGEYVGRIYEEVKRRPLYIASERIGFAERQSGVESEAAGRNGDPRRTAEPAAETAGEGHSPPG